MTIITKINSSSQVCESVKLGHSESCYLYLLSATRMLSEFNPFPNQCVIKVLMNVTSRVGIKAQKCSELRRKVSCEPNLK